MKNTRRSFIGALTALIAAPALAAAVATKPKKIVQNGISGAHRRPGQEELRDKIMQTNLCPEITEPTRYTLAADFDGDVQSIHFQMPEETLEQLIERTRIRVEAANKRALEEAWRTLEEYSVTRKSLASARIYTSSGSFIPKQMYRI